MTCSLSSFRFQLTYNFKWGHLWFLFLNSSSPTPTLLTRFTMLYYPPWPLFESDTHTHTPIYTYAHTHRFTYIHTYTYIHTNIYVLYIFMKKYMFIWDNKHIMEDNTEWVNWVKSVGVGELLKMKYSMLAIFFFWVVHWYNPDSENSAEHIIDAQ